MSYFKNSMIIDAHVHLFKPAIITNVALRTGLVSELHLQAHAVNQRIGSAALLSALKQAGVSIALNLPTSRAADVCQVNRSAMAIACKHDGLKTAGTLHPFCEDIQTELENLHASGIRAIKLCSFSQYFELTGHASLSMFDHIETYNRQVKAPFFVVLDTFFKADTYFGSHKSFITTPSGIHKLAKTFTGIVFVCAHMGGLTAPFKDIVRWLIPSENLYLDTSNAAHTLKTDEFINLLKIHGPDRIIFGTDWPWFEPSQEIHIIQDLLNRAGFSPHDHSMVFGNNIANLLGL